MSKVIKIQPKVTNAERDLKLAFIQNMNGNTKCNFCQFFQNGECMFTDFNSNFGEWKNKPRACNAALEKLMQVLKS